MRSSVVVVTLQLVCVIFSAATGEATSYSQSASFSTLRASHSEIFSVVGRVRTLVERANAGQDPEYGEEKVLLGGGNSELKLTRGFSQDDFSGAPRPTLRFWYEYWNRSAPISRVDINLRDHSREVEVEGASKEQVEALVALLTADLEKLEAGIGGTLERTLGGTLLLVLGAVLAGISSTLTPFSGLARWLVLVMGISLQISVWILPWESWFPGTMILPENTSFLERSGALISLLGLLVTLIGVAVPIGKSILVARSNPNEARI